MQRRSEPHARSHQFAPGVHVPHAEPARSHVGQHVPVSRPPCERPLPVAGEEVVACPVACDHPNARPIDVCDPRVRSRPAPARAVGSRTGERPAHVAVGLECCDLVVPRRDDEAPERRPAGLAVPREQPLRAVRLDDPDAGSGGDEKPAARREREQRGLRLLDANDLAHTVDHHHSGRARHGEQRRRRPRRRRRSRCGFRRGCAARARAPRTRRGRRRAPGCGQRPHRDGRPLQLVVHSSPASRRGPGEAAS